MFQKKNGFRAAGRYVLNPLLPASVLVSAVMLSTVPSGCRSSIEGVEFLEGDFFLPQVDSIQVCDSNRISMDFSKGVTIERAGICSEDGTEESVSVESQDGERRVDFVMENRMVIGRKYVIDAVAVDEKGNSLTVSADFLGYNDRVPCLALSEIRIKNKSKSDRSEFVELYALTSGNLSGLELVCASDGESKKYSFPPVEVSKGEYVVVHMRNGSDGCRDETDGRLNAASTSDSSPLARDFFADNASEGRFGTGADVIALRNGASGKIMDAFVYADPGKLKAWTSQLESLASQVQRDGAWLDSDGNSLCSMDTAFSTTTLNRESHSACRKNVQNLSPENLASGAVQWYEVGTMKEQTPGRRN